MPRIFRKYYTPGLISLIFLPVLCYAHLYKYLHPKKEYAIQLNMPGKDGQFGSHHFPPARVYENIELTGVQPSDSIKLSNTTLLIRKILARKDTVEGIRVLIGKKVRYQSLISLLDICEFENARIYGWKEDGFWIAPVIKIPSPTADSAIKIELISL